MKNLVIINGKQLRIREYKSERVITVWDIAEVQGHKVGKINQQFKRNREKLVEDEDYFVLSREEFEKIFLGVDFIPNNVKEIPVFTMLGYFMFLKVFDDDLSWEIQRELIKEIKGDDKHE